MIRHSNGWLKQSSGIKPGFSVGKKLENLIKATNHRGYEVQEYQPGAGWVPAIEKVVGYTADDVSICEPMVVETKAAATALMTELQAMPHRIKRELRVCEAVQFPVKK